MKLRINETKKPLYDFQFSSSADVYEKMKEYSKADREMFMVMYMTAKNHVVDCELHSIGAVDTSAVYIKELFRGALLANASSIICVHNHPSGDCTPSEADNQITKEILKAAINLQIPFLDHVIIGNAGYYSYADDGVLAQYEMDYGKLPDLL